MNAEKLDGNESHNGRQQSDSNTDALVEFEPALEKSRVTAEPKRELRMPPKGYPPGFVLKACPEIIDYAIDGIGSWRDFMAVAADRHADALEATGQENTVIVIARILHGDDVHQAQDRQKDRGGLAW